VQRAPTVMSDPCAALWLRCEATRAAARDARSRRARWVRRFDASAPRWARAQLPWQSKLLASLLAYLFAFLLACLLATVTNVKR